MESRPPPLSRWAINGDVRLHYLDTSERHDRDLAAAPAVVFLPGFGEEAFDHLDLIDTLAPHRVIVPDLRGRGPSDSPPSGYDLGAHVDDLSAVVDATGTGRVHLAAYSRGSAYAFGWAAQHPTRVASIMIGEYQLVPPAEAAAMLASRERFGRPITDRIKPEVITAIFDAATHFDFGAPLTAIASPLLVVHGTRPSSLVTPDALTAYRSARPDAVIEAWDDCGHDLWRPEPDRFARRLRAFIDDASG